MRGMTETIPLIEKTFEIWPGLMRFAAAGDESASDFGL